MAQMDLADLYFPKFLQVQLRLEVLVVRQSLHHLLVLKVQQVLGCLVALLVLVVPVIRYLRQLQYYLADQTDQMDLAVQVSLKAQPHQRNLLVL